MSRMGLGMGLGLRRGGAAAPPALSAVVTPASRPWLGEAGDWQTAAFTCTPSNAVGTPTFFWGVVNDAGAEILIDQETSAATFIFSTEIAKPVGATIRCLVTDDNGSVYSNTVSTT